MELCNLKLVIYREEDPAEKDREQIRVKLINELEMTEVEVCQQINVTTPQSRRYHVREASVIVLRQAVSQAFREGLIDDSLGAWKILKLTPSSPIEIEMDSTDSTLWSIE
jgi:hypothetical protein